MTYWADVAQLVEQPIRNRQVSGSSPLVGSSLFHILVEPGYLVRNTSWLALVPANGIQDQFIEADSDLAHQRGLPTPFPECV